MAILFLFIILHSIYIYGINSLIKQNEEKSAYDADYKENRRMLICGKVLIYAGIILECIMCIYEFIQETAEHRIQIIENDRRYDVVQVLYESDKETVTCINEKDEIGTGRLYDICYDENAENLYAVEIVEKYELPEIIKKIGSIKDKKYFRIYTNNMSYVEEQNIYYQISEMRD